MLRFSGMQKSQYPLHSRIVTSEASILPVLPPSASLAYTTGAHLSRLWVQHIRQVPLPRRLYSVHATQRRRLDAPADCPAALCLVGVLHLWGGSRLSSAGPRAHEAITSIANGTLRTRKGAASMVAAGLLLQAPPALCCILNAMAVLWAANYVNH